MKINVAIVDDHQMVIDGIKSMLALSPEISIVGAYNSATTLLEGLKQKIPDVLLLDIQLPDQTGDEIAPIILKRYPSIKILTLTNYTGALYVNNMLRRGVKGYILKTVDKEKLYEAIQSVHAGGEYIDAALLDQMNQLDEQIKNIGFSKSTLTPREKEILQLIVNGETCASIAKILFLSNPTVINYRTMILRKLDVNNSASLVKKALLLGLVH